MTRAYITVQTTGFDYQLRREVWQALPPHATPEELRAAVLASLALDRKHGEAQG